MESIFVYGSLVRASGNKRYTYMVMNSFDPAKIDSKEAKERLRVFLSACGSILNLNGLIIAGIKAGFSEQDVLGLMDFQLMKAGFTADVPTINRVNLDQQEQLKSICASAHNEVVKIIREKKRSSS